MECRICFEDASRCDLISPCRCSGTSAFVHRNCLQRWRETSDMAARRCAECHYMYQIEYRYPLETANFIILTEREMAGLRFILTSVILTFVIILRLVDKYSQLSLQNFLRPWRENHMLKEIIREDSFFEFAYFFSIITFFLNILFMGSWVRKFCSVKRKKLYFKYSRSSILQYIVYSNHSFILYNLFTISNEEEESMQSIEYFLCFNFFITLLQYILASAMTKYHNTILNLMNSQDNTDVVLELGERV